MAAKHKKNTPAHACATTTAPAIQSNDCATFRNISAHTTAQAQNRQPRYTLKYLQTAPNSRSQTAPNSRRCLTLNGERRLLPGIVPPIGSQTAARSEHHLARESEHHLARESEHHLARESEHHLRPPRIRISYGLTVRITLYPAILRLGGRDCGDSPPMAVCALEHTTIWAYADMRLGAYNDIVICAYAHRRIKAYNGSVIRFYDFITIKFQNSPIDTTLAGP
jgi:hypothetical protein